MATIMSLQAGVAFPAERLEFDSSEQSPDAQNQPAANQSGDGVIKILSDIKAMLQLAHDNCPVLSRKLLTVAPSYQFPATCDQAGKELLVS